MFHYLSERRFDLEIPEVRSFQVQETCHTMFYDVFTLQNFWFQAVEVRPQIEREHFSGIAFVDEIHDEIHDSIGVLYRDDVRLCLCELSEIVDDDQQAVDRCAGKTFVVDIPKEIDVLFVVSFVTTDLLGREQRSQPIFETAVFISHTVHTTKNILESGQREERQTKRPGGKKMNRPAGRKK